jgi:hypothetical protein
VVGEHEQFWLVSLQTNGRFKFVFLKKAAITCKNGSTNDNVPDFMTAVSISLFDTNMHMARHA